MEKATEEIFEILERHGVIPGELTRPRQLDMARDAVTEYLWKTFLGYPVLDKASLELKEIFEEHRDCDVFMLSVILPDGPTFVAATGVYEDQDPIDFLGILLNLMQREDKFHVWMDELEWMKKIN